MARRILMPALGAYTAEGQLLAWLAPDCTRVQEGQVVLEMETEKAVHRVEAPASGTLHHSASVGAVLKQGAVLGYILGEGEKPPFDGERPDAPILSAKSCDEVDRCNGRDVVLEGALGSSHRIVSSPRARRIAAEHRIDLGSLKGTGPGGRIVEADVLNRIQQHESVQAPDGPVSSSVRIRERIALSPMRRTIGRRLRTSVNTAISLTLTREVEVDPLVRKREELSARHGLSVPFDALFVYFFARALRQHRTLNSFIENDELLMLDEVNVAVAVEVPEGLLAPVVRQPDQHKIVDLAVRIRELAESARRGEMDASALEGATATLTNLGRFGVDGFTPILNPPQSCILGAGRVKPRPVVRDGQLGVASTVVLSLTFDHRVTDGAPAARLLETLAREMNAHDLLEQL